MAKKKDKDFKKALGSHWRSSLINLTQSLLSKIASKKAAGGMTRVGMFPRRRKLVSVRTQKLIVARITEDWLDIVLERKSKATKPVKMNPSLCVKRRSVLKINLQLAMMILYGQFGSKAKKRGRINLSSGGIALRGHGSEIR